MSTNTTELVKLHLRINDIQRGSGSQKGQLGARKSSNAKERPNGRGRGGEEK